MKPILYKANEATFETYGLGEIDATKALVTRERNGNYTLYIEYPASGRLASVFKNDMRIKSDAGLRTDVLHITYSQIKQRYYQNLCEAHQSLDRVHGYPK